MRAKAAATLAHVENGVVSGVLLVVLALLVVGCEGGGGERRETAAREPETATGESVAAGALRGDRLVSALRRGGYVLYFRHAATDSVRDDADPVVLPDCDTQRNLSAAGRRQARAVGRAIENLDIPIGRVLVSPFCRTIDTARLAFGRATREPVLENLETADREAERQGRIDDLRRLLSTPAAANVVLVAHGFNVSAAADVTIDEGEAAIFRPRRPVGFTLVGTITAGEWEVLAQRLGSERPAVVREYAVPTGSAPHDVAPAPD